MKLEKIEINKNQVNESSNVDLALLDLTNHKGLNDSLNVSQEGDSKKSSGVKSNGIYSVLNNKWIKAPTQASIPDIDKEEFEKLFKGWEDKYFDLLEELESSGASKDKPKSELVNDFIEDIYELRKSSIDKEGEYGLKNLVFKEFRNLGYLDNLKDLKNELKSKELSLESLNKLCESINRGDDITTQGLKKLLENK